MTHWNILWCSYLLWNIVFKWGVRIWWQALSKYGTVAQQFSYVSANLSIRSSLLLKTLSAQLERLNCCSFTVVKRLRNVLWHCEKCRIHYYLPARQCCLCRLPVDKLALEYYRPIGFALPHQTIRPLG